MRKKTRSIVGAIAGAAVLTLGVTLSAQAEDAPAAGAVDGKALWTKNCASCHGPDGKAKTKMGEMLKVRDLTDPAVHATLTRDGVLKAIKEGVKDASGKQVMKGYADRLSDAESGAVADHVMSLK